MGTNYYLEEPACPTCGRAPEPVHIGKSSCGWCFALHVTDEIKSLTDWAKAWERPEAVIRDEYGHTIDPEMMMRIVTRAGLVRVPAWSIEELRLNQAQRGPKGLARSILDGVHCVGHGDGAWDLISGEFS